MCMKPYIEKTCSNCGRKNKKLEDDNGHCIGCVKISTAATPYPGWQEPEAAHDL